MIVIFHSYQVSVLDEKPNLNISTFRPQGQMVNDNKKYNGFGYIPCNGYVPCQVCTMGLMTNLVMGMYLTRYVQWVWLNTL